MANTLVYDIEVIRAIPARHNPPIAGIEYATSWTDFQNMGVACICAYDYVEKRYRVFSEGNWQDFLLLAQKRVPLVGFNNINFDNQVIAATLTNRLKNEVSGLFEPFMPEGLCYDLKREIWAANGLGPVFVPATHDGFGLDAVASANGLGRKAGNGALAPVWWQQGQYGHVIDYCLQDVNLTRKLFDLAIENKVKDPKTGQLLNLRPPP